MPHSRYLPLACAVIALVSGGAARGAAPVLADVVYDPAAPLDPDRSYGCMADPQLGAASTGTRTLVCVERVPLSELCGTEGEGLPADCPFLPGSPGRGPTPTRDQIATLADALLRHFKGHEPKLNFAAERISRGAREGYEMNWQPRAQASPSVGAWNESSAAGREIVDTPLEVTDPSPADPRYGNTAWRNPAANPAEWNALMASGTLDAIALAARNVLATPEVPDPSPAAVSALATAEVAKCRDESLELIREDLESHLGRASGLAWARPGGSVGCLEDPGPPPPPLRQPPPPTTKQCWDGSVVPVAQSCPARPPPNTRTTTRQPPPPPRTKTCWDNSVIPVSQSCPARPPPNTRTTTRQPPPPTTKTCWDNSVIPVSQSCPARPPRTPTKTTTRQPPPPPKTTTRQPPPPPKTTTKTTTTTTKKTSTDCLLPGFCDPPPPKTTTTTTKTCPDGSVVAKSATCPTKPPPPPKYTDCKGGEHATAAAAARATARKCPPPPPPPKYTDCKGGEHATAAAAARATARKCPPPPPPPKYTDCKGGEHATAAAAARATARKCPPPPPPPKYTDCKGGEHATAAAAARATARKCPPPPPPPKYTDCKGNLHATSTAAARVKCPPPKDIPPPKGTYDRDAVTCQGGPFCPFRNQPG